MASLREESRLVRAAYERPFNTGGLIIPANDENLTDYFLEHPLFISDTVKSLINLSAKEKAEREHKIFTLIRACKQDDLIEPVTQERTQIDYSKWGGALYYDPNGDTTVPTRTYTTDLGYHATSKGTDLLTFFGFLTIALEKHKPVGLILGSSLVTGFVVWLVTSTPTLACNIPHLGTMLAWCKN